VTSPALKRTGEMMISVDVKNTGKVLGDEVVQLYVQHLHSTVTRPERELKGFVRVTLQPGETRTVRIPVKASSLAYWDQINKGFIVEKDDVRLLVGSSSADIRQNTLLHVVD
jgi:beta-glucosidase